MGGLAYAFAILKGVDARRGRVGGFVCGTDVYTLDSTLALDAVHASLLKTGESKILGVTILDNQNLFAASTRIGITSGS